MSSPEAEATHTAPVLIRWWRSWWRGLSPAKQDRLVGMGPLLSILLFMGAITAALTYFTLEESHREHEAIARDVEYAQQRLRLRLIERQEQLMRIARDISNREIEETAFGFQAESLITQHPELLAITWLNARREVVTAHVSPSAPEVMNRMAGRMGRGRVNTSPAAAVKGQGQSPCQVSKG